MPYSHLLPADLRSMSTDELKARDRELGYQLDALRGNHSPDAELDRLKIDLARERIRVELHHRNGHG